MGAEPGSPEPQPVHGPSSRGQQKPQSLGRGPLPRPEAVGVGWLGWTAGGQEHFSVCPLSSHHPVPRRCGWLGEGAAWGSWDKAAWTKPAHTEPQHAGNTLEWHVLTHATHLAVPHAKPEPMGTMDPPPSSAPNGTPLGTLGLPLTKNLREHAGALEMPRPLTGVCPSTGTQPRGCQVMELPRRAEGALAMARLSGECLTNTPAEAGRVLPCQTRARAPGLWAAGRPLS